MARTVAEIEQVILDAKTAEAGLAGLTSTSKTAIWRLWVKIIALAHWVLENLWDTKAKELQSLAAATVAGTDRWYADQMLKFQYGHALTVNSNGQLVYLVEDEAAQIIAKVAIVTESGVLHIKVAKDNGGLEKLTDAEKVSVESYVNDIKFAGTSHLLFSLDADLVKIQNTKVYYDGKLVLADVQTAVEVAINDYLRNIYFNGYFNLNQFRDAIEAVSGVEGGPDIGSVEAKPAGGVYSSVTREYNPSSGYFAIDPAFPLSDATVIEYIPK